MGTPPPHLYRAETIAKFQTSLKETFLAGHTPLTILVTDETILVEAKPEAAAKWMAYAASGEPLVNPEADVLANDMKWLRLLDSNQRPGG